MKKILITLFFVSVLILPLVTSAANTLPTNVQNVLDRAKNAVWSIFLVAAMICFVYAAFLFLTSSGDQQKIQTAKKAVMWGVVGLAVGFFAASITGIIGGWFS